MSKTEKLLKELNAARRLAYPDIGYLCYANIRGDGSRPGYKSIYRIVNAGGGVSLSTLNKRSATRQCQAIGDAIRAELPLT
jgi:hypothetical protein